MSHIVSEIYDAFRELGLGEAEAAAAAIPGQRHVATKADIADLKADIAGDFQVLCRHLWIMGVGIVAAIVTLTRMLP